MWVKSKKQMPLQKYKLRFEYFWHMTFPNMQKEQYKKLINKRKEVK